MDRQRYFIFLVDGRNSSSVNMFCRTVFLLFIKTLLDVLDDDGVDMFSGKTVVKLSLNDEAVDGVPVFGEDPVCWTGSFYIPYGWKV